MSYVILHDGPKQASAYSVSLLAGCAGFGTDDQFLEACRDDDDLLMNTARQVDPYMREEGADGVAEGNLRQRLRELRLDIVEGFPTRPVSADDKKFETLMRTGQAGVLAQAGRMERVRKCMTTAALTLATAAAMTFSGVGVTDAHAQNVFERFAKDTIGGVIGGGIGSQMGKGRGKTAMTVLGAATGVVVAEAMQRPTIATPNGNFTMGTEPLSLDKKDKMHTQEMNVLTTRDAYARSLYVAQQADESRVLDPRNKATVDAATSASAVVQTLSQRYAQARTDFGNAYEYMGSHGYDVNEFSQTYTLIQRQVTAKDMNLRDMSAIQPQPAVRRAATSNELSL